MRYRLALGIGVIAITMATPSIAVPDEAFTQAHFAYVDMKRQEFLAPILAKGLTPTAAQSAEATCRALMFWKIANPGGEAKLTYMALVALRRAEILCGQKMRRPPPLPIETGNPPRTAIPPSEWGPKNDPGADAAGEDFVRWHQVTIENAANITEYVRARLVAWGLLGAGEDLYEALQKALEAQKAAYATPGANTKSADAAVDAARQRLAAAEAEEAAKAAEEYARAHKITVDNAANIMEYVRAQVFVWGFSDEAKKLYEDLQRALAAQKEAYATPGGNTRSADAAVDAARARIAAAEAEAATKAAEEYARAHPITAQNAASTMEFVNSRVFLWERSEEGKTLYQALADAEAARKQAYSTPGANTKSADQAVDAARRQIEAARAAEGEKSRQEWRAAHPGQPETWPNYPVPFEQLPPSTQREIAELEKRTADGSVDPLNEEAWRRARLPATVGANGDVGSAARTRDKVLSTVLGFAGGLLGGGGGGGGPNLARCNITDNRMTVFQDRESGVALKVGAQRMSNNVIVFADIDQSPDAGTFQTSFVHNPKGEFQSPANVGICKLHGDWSLSVSWTRTTYVNNQVVDRQSGGWSKSGEFFLPGTLTAASAPDGLWKRLGFSNASHGAKMVSLTYALPPAQLSEGANLVIHVTRPGQEPVTTTPFILRMQETPQGFAFQRILQ